MVVNFDARTLPSDMYQPSPARFTIAAHDGAACALDVNPHIRGCLATAGTDKMVKIWNVQGEGDGSGGKRQVSLVAGRDLGLVRGSFPFAVSTYERDVMCLLYRLYSGRGVFDSMVARRSINACRGGFEGEVADLGRRRELWCAQSFRYETLRSWTHIKREKEWRRRRRCG